MLLPAANSLLHGHKTGLTLESKKAHPYWVILSCTHWSVSPTMAHLERKESNGAGYSLPGFGKACGVEPGDRMDSPGSIYPGVSCQHGLLTHCALPSQDS